MRRTEKFLDWRVVRLPANYCLTIRGKVKVKLSVSYDLAVSLNFILCR